MNSNKFGGSQSTINPPNAQGMSPVQTGRKSPENRGSNLSQSVALKSALDKRMIEAQFAKNASELRGTPGQNSSILSTKRYT